MHLVISFFLAVLRRLRALHDKGQEVCISLLVFLLVPIKLLELIMKAPL
jgi:hypothetical protein